MPGNCFLWLHLITKEIDGVWISVTLPNNHIFLQFYFSVFSLVLVSVEKIYQTLKTVLDHISKQLEVRQKYSAACQRYFELSSRCLEMSSKITSSKLQLVGAQSERQRAKKEGSPFFSLAVFSSAPLLTELLSLSSAAAFRLVSNPKCS